MFHQPNRATLGLNTMNKKVNISFVKSITLSIVLTCTAGSSILFADDTEVFFGAQTTQSTSYPNVLFVFDTSGSMGSKDNTGISRIDRMKTAVESILDTATNINVGMMRFNGTYGGSAVVYPVTYIDKELCPNGVCVGADPSVQLEVRVNSSDGDATETVSGLTVVTDDSVLKMFETENAVSNEIKSYKLVNNQGDVEHSSIYSGSSGYIDYSVDMDAFYDTYSGWSSIYKAGNYGLHFPNIDIDPGVTITSAKIIQEGITSGKGIVGANIFAHDAVDSPSFLNSSGRRLNDRVRTSEVVNWPSIPFTSYNGQAIETPDISSLIDSRVNSSGWVSGNNISIIFEPDPTVSTPDSDHYRQFKSYNGGSRKTELKIGYQTGSGLQKVGMRFDDLRIPQGATITSASVEFVSHDTNSSPTSANIVGHDADDSPVFTTSNGNISARSTTSANVSWTPSNWNVNSIQSIGEKYQTTDISTIVQEIVDRSGWCGGNALSVILEGTGLREAVSFDQTAKQAPLLKVSYDATSISSTGGCTVADMQASIATGSDDTEENLSSGSITTTSSDLEMPYDGSNKQLVGLRFRGLLIPRNATITSAKLTFEVDESASGSSSMYIQADANPAPAILSSNRYNLSSRSKTVETVNWNSVASPAVNEKISTPDVSPIVQELVNKTGWSSGNDMVFLFSRKSGNGRRTYESYNGEAVAAPSLTVSYRVTGAAASSGSAQITYQTTREKLKTQLDDMMVTGGTPIVSSLYEAAQYYKNGPVQYGKERGVYSTNRYHRVSHPLSYTGGSLVTPNNCDNDTDPNNNNCKYEEITGSSQYITPINDSCQSNHIVLLSDGSPTGEPNIVTTRVESLIGSSCASTSSSKRCGVELLSYLKGNDQSTSVAGMQDITTYTIGFNFTSQWMKDLAQAGGGSFYEASSSSSLVDAFNKILGEILKVDTSFVSPGATVNQFNRLTHRNDIYFSLFKPSEKPTWAGNLKQYRLAGDPAQIVDANGDPAVDSESGYFKDTAQSIWSDVVDGSTVSLGGAANEITLSNRNVYTYTGGQTDLTHSNNRFHETNNSLTKEMLNISGQTDSYKDELVKWARGVDVKDENGDNNTGDVRKHMGDPMHSRPLIINYSDTDSVIFIATNEGFLHVIDSDDGSDIYSFIPNELLPNLNTFYTNSTAVDHPYGLDGDLTTWFDETNNKRYLYIGMRRGGNKYYALDITQREKPQLEWIIDGDSNSDFTQLGQTWSKPFPTKIKVAGVERKVLIFAGGYDTNQDSATTIQADSSGNALYIVDAKTGALVWSGGNTGSGATKTFSGMDYSIPSDISLVDINSDGYTDQLYVGDMGGQVWRFDLDATASNASELVKGGIMASLSDTGTSNARRFFFQPDVAILNDLGESALAISIGSGWRSHPLDTVVEDRFYMFRSEDIYTAPAGYGIQRGNSSIYRPIEEDDLINVTNTLNADMSTGHGWMLEMESTGEKVLAKSITINNQVLFTTYRPEEAATACSAALGGGALYAVNLRDGGPTSNLDEQGTDENLTKTDRVTALTHGGIPPEAIVLFPTDATNSAAIEPIILVATEQVDGLDLGLGTQRTFWQTPE